MEDGFEKANSENLPKVDLVAVANFFAHNPFGSDEFQNSRTSPSSRQSYGDDAVGYVQLKRQSNICTVKSKVCPEHKVHQKKYSVNMLIDENMGIVQSIQCDGCPGSCKHAVTFLMWAHRRSEAPTTTDTKYYWKKPKLMETGNSLKFITVQDMCGTRDDSQRKKKRKNNSKKNPQDVLRIFLEEGIKRKLQNCPILKYQPDYEIEPIFNLSMHYLSLKYNSEDDLELFLNNVRSVATKDLLDDAERQTCEQDTSPAWHELRYARITESEAFEVSQSTTPDESLISIIMGGNVPSTPSRKRGTILKTLVKKQLEKQLGNISPCGLFISHNNPVLAASPDGIMNDTVIEMKCPVNKQTFKKYLSKGKVTAKYYARVQLQMYVTNLKKALFCVASWDFEQNNEILIVSIEYNSEYVSTLVNDLVAFWKTNIYPVLYESTK